MRSVAQNDYLFNAEPQFRTILMLSSLVTGNVRFVHHSPGHACLRSPSDPVQRQYPLQMLRRCIASGFVRRSVDAGRHVREDEATCSATHSGSDKGAKHNAVLSRCRKRLHFSNRNRGVGPSGPRNRRSSIGSEHHKPLKVQWAAVHARINLCLRAFGTLPKGYSVNLLDFVECKR
jgi:hypothetical protein